MRREAHGIGSMFGWRILPAVLLAVAVLAGGLTAVARADEDTTPAWTQSLVAQFETEAMNDIAMIPEIPAAVAREWRSFDRNGSAAGTVVDIGWVVLAALAGIGAHRLVVRRAGRGRRQRMRARAEGATLGDLLSLLLIDIIGLVVFIAVFSLIHRHGLSHTQESPLLAAFAERVLVRWRMVVVVVGVVFRPSEPAARLIELDDLKARRLARFMSVVGLIVIGLVAFSHFGLMDEDGGASHVVGILIAVIVCGFYGWTVVRVRDAGEKLIGGRPRDGMMGVIRTAIARAWVPGGLTIVAALFVFFVAGLSLGLLNYLGAVTSTLTVMFVLLILERLTERGYTLSSCTTPEERSQHLMGKAVQHILVAALLAGGVMTILWNWVTAFEVATADKQHILGSVGSSVATLFGAYVVWALCRLAIDRNLQAGGGPALPGDDDENAAPASRLQTILPLLRATFATAIAILAVLLALSRLGVNTAPLIAGASIFGLAVSFGSQALVRDIISGVFYMWDDAFRVGEYIDTGRLKGTVEMLGIRSVKLRHQNGPLHTIPYGQLGAVTNLSRDFATIKFNLRFDPRTDIELVRRTTKQIGVQMVDENEEMATEIMQPLKLQGIAEVADAALVLRFKFTARPLKPSWVQREYLKRMYTVFSEKQIRFASGAVFLQTVPPTDTGASQPAVAPPSAPPEESSAAALAVAATAALGTAAVLEMAEMGTPANSNA